jgi:hypothetical protein
MTIYYYYFMNEKEGLANATTSGINIVSGIPTPAATTKNAAPTTAAHTTAAPTTAAPTTAAPTISAATINSLISAIQAAAPVATTRAAPSAAPAAAPVGTTRPAPLTTTAASPVATTRPALLTTTAASPVATTRPASLTTTPLMTTAASTRPAPLTTTSPASHVTNAMIPSNYTPIPAGGIPVGYYHILVNGKDMMAPIPYGYATTADKNTIVPITQTTVYDANALSVNVAVSNTPTSFIADVNGNLIPGSPDDPSLFSTTIGSTKDNVGSTKYDPDSYDSQYHDDTNTILERNPDIGFDTTYVYDQDGNPVLISKLKMQGNSTYNVPGTYVYGPATYVPNYEESVYLSKTSKQPSYSEIYDTASMQAGFCTQYANSPNELERMCNNTELNKCGSMSCCVLLGGSKCVAGSESGPLLKTNYSDKLVQDPTYYYFQGNCFGNCGAKVY